MAQTMSNVQSVSKLAAQPALSRRPSPRPFTVVASAVKTSAPRRAASDHVKHFLTTSTASALLLAQPAFADVHLVASLAESSGPVEQLKGKFFGAQDPIAQRKALGEYTGKNTTGGFDELGIGRQEDATIDNPNDSPRPKDRSRQGTAEAKAENLDKFAATQASTSDVDVQNNS